MRTSRARRSPCHHMRPRATLLLSAIFIGLTASATLRPKPLLLLRGGVQPQMAEEADASVDAGVLPKSPPAVVRRNSRSMRSQPGKSKLKLSTRKRKGGSPLRDAAAAALCLAAIGTGLSTNFDSYLAAVPPQARGLVWLCVGGAFAVGLFALVAVTSYRRAVALCQLLFGDEPSLSVPPMLFALGAAASMQSLPAAAG